MRSILTRWHQKVPIGSRSVLYGAHCFFIHPWFVAIAWWKLYGFPWDPRLWVAFFIHDLGYWGKPNMDRPEGETHPRWAARVMGQWFGGKWALFVLLHSRFLCQYLNCRFSRLCVADKLAVALEPWWLYLPRVWATGEYKEYMSLAQQRDPSGASDVKYASMNINTETSLKWHQSMTDYLRVWAYEHIHDAWLFARDIPLPPKED